MSEGENQIPSQQFMKLKIVVTPFINPEIKDPSCRRRLLADEVGSGSDNSNACPLSIDKLLHHHQLLAVITLNELYCSIEIFSNTVAYGKDKDPHACHENMKLRIFPKLHSFISTTIMIK